MSKRVVKFFVLTIASFFISCSQNDKVSDQVIEEQAKAPKAQPIVEVKSFVPPASTKISVEKAKMYVKASASLVELGNRWSQRIDKASDLEKVQILNAYNVARDQLCARIGLEGGIAEFDWITDNALKNVDNMDAFEKAGLKITSY